MFKKLRLHLLEETFAFSKLPQFAELPVTLSRGEMCFVFRTDEELSVISPEFMAPTNVQQEIGWRCIRADGEMPFKEAAMVFSLTMPLASANIPLLTVTTFNAVYCFFQEEHLVEAVKALQQAGHEFSHKE